MAKQEVLPVITQQLDANAAARGLRTMTADDSATIERKVLYPYHRFSANCTVPTIFGKESLSVTCLVDGVNALGAKTDPFEAERITVAAEEVMSM